MIPSEIKSQIINVLGIIISLIAILISFYGQFIDAQTGAILFLGILAFVVLYFIVSYFIIGITKRFNQLKANSLSILDIKKDLNNLKDNFNIIKDGANLNARLSFLENKMKNKKAQIDPRIIILIIILILLFLYLRSKGYI